MISRKFIHSSLIYSFVGGLSLVSGVILIPLFTIYLSPEDFGINAIYFSIIALFQILLAYNLEMYVGVRYIDYKDDKIALSKHVSNVFFLLILFGLVTILLLLLLGPRAFNFVFGQSLHLYPWGLLTILTGYFNGMLKSYSNLLIFQQRPKAFLWINLSNFILIIAVSMGLIYAFPFTLIGPIYGRMIPAGISCLLVIFLVHHQYGLTFHKEFFVKILKYTTPLVILSLLNWLIFNIDRFLILRFLDDPSLVGIFDIALKLALVLELLCAGISSSINPKVFSLLKDKNLKESTPEIMRYYNGFLAVMLLIIPVLVFISPILINLFIKKPLYHEATVYLLVLCLSFIPRVHLYMYVSPLYFFNKTRILPKVYLLATMIQLPITVIFIHFFGLWGAAWAAFINKPILTLIMYLYSRSTFSFKLNAVKQIYLPLIYTGIMLCIDLVTPVPLKTQAYGIAIVISFFLVYYVYRREIKMLLQSVRK